MEASLPRARRRRGSTAVKSPSFNICRVGDGNGEVGCIGLGVECRGPCGALEVGGERHDGLEAEIAGLFLSEGGRRSGRENERGEKERRRKEARGGFPEMETLAPLIVYLYPFPNSETNFRR